MMARWSLGAFRHYGGDSSSVETELQSGVAEVFAAANSFAALKEDGSVVAWGKDDEIGDYFDVQASLQSVYKQSSLIAQLSQH